MHLYFEQAEEAARQVVAVVATAVAEVDVDVATRSRYVHTSKGGWTKKIRTRLGSSFSYITSRRKYQTVYI